MLEKAGQGLSRRDFIKGIWAMGGVLAFGDKVSSVFAENKTMDKNAGADAIYYGGPIVTMIQNGHRVEALAVQNGNIPAVGSLKEVMAKKRAGPIE